MAITLHKQFLAYNPAYNETFCLVSSSNSGQPNFKYVFDVYATDGTTLLTRVKLPARPSDTRCFFDAKRILENLVSYDLGTVDEAAGFYQNTNSYYKYTVKVGEEYGTTPVLSSGLTSMTNRTIWNAAMTHDEYRQYNQVNPFINIGEAAGEPLTQSPTALRIEADQNAWLYMATYYSNSIYNGIVKKYNSAGTLLGTLTIANPYEALASDADKFVRFACGTANLNAHTTNWIDSNVSYYTVHIEDVNAFTVSPTYTYTVTENCQYETVRLHWLNTRGGFDAFNFSMKSSERQTIQRDSYRQRYGSTSGTTWSYTMAQRGNTTFNTEVNESFNINSDWISEAESTWLAGLVSSPEVYRELDGVLYAVDMLPTEYALQKKVNQKLFNLALSFKYSFNNTKQRG